MPKDRKFILLLAAVVVVVALEILSLSGVRLPMPWAPIFFGAFIFAVGGSVLWKGAKALSVLRFSSINLLMLIAVVGAFYLGEYPEAAVVITLYVLGERLEDHGIDQSRSALKRLVGGMPKTVDVKDAAGPVPIAEVPVGSVVVVRPGEMIPLDGVVIGGQSAVDEAAITGESLPKDKQVDDIVHGGTLNKQGMLEIRTTSTSEDTTLARIVDTTFRAMGNRSETQRFIDRFAGIYTPVVVGLAVLLVLVPVYFLHQPFDHWLEQAITILVIACPCALVISTPVAIYSAIGNAGRKGAVVKGGKYMEALAGLKVVGLDKTRTITTGQPVVEDVLTFGGTDEEELLGCAAGAEAFSEHPLAQAVVQRAVEAGIEPHRVTDFSSTVGHGIQAECMVCDHDAVLVGKLAHIAASRKTQPEAITAVEQLQGQGKTAVVVSFHDAVSGVLGITDAVKPESKQAVADLKAIGVLPVMLTGDNEQAARHVAEWVGIDQVHGNLLPEDKAAHIIELQRTVGPAAHVGDGVNDAPALATADVGIAMGALGSDTAMETASVALMNDDLRTIPYLIQLARATLKRIKVNTALAILVKVAFLLLAVLGHSHLVLAVVADVGVTILVIFTSLQLMRWRQKGGLATA